MDEGILQSEGLVSAICYLGLLFKSIPAGVVVEPQQIAMDVGHLARDDDLVAVEVVGLLVAFSVFIDRVSYGLRLAKINHTYHNFHK